MVTTVCPIGWYSHHRYLNGDIPLCDLDNSSGRGKIPKSETPGSDMRNLPKRSGIAAYEARNICGVLASRRAGQIRSFFVKKITVETTPTQAPWPPAGTQQQHPPTHKAQAQEQQESAPPLASSASLITDHSAASMRALSASLSTHGLGLLLDLLSTTMFTDDSSLMMWFKER